ncbi:MAG: hypothetical protein OQL16_05805 [Gammaproteobacteria bacterium]|nr:hypothetical protein [Gammaproteobacteria bacterium]
MQNYLSEFDDEYMDEDGDQEYQFRKPSRSRRKLEEYMEQRRLKHHLMDDYDYNLDD